MRPNIPERAARWSAAHWKTATFGWLVFVAAAVMLGQLLGTDHLSDSEKTTGEPARAERALSASGLHLHAGEAALIRSSRLDAGAPMFRREIEAVAASLSRSPQVVELSAPLAGVGGEISKDRHAALVEFHLRGSPESAADRVQPILDRVARLQRAAPSFRVTEFGDASAQRELNETVNRDFAHAEGLSVPATFLILLLAFGAFAAAGVPVLLAFSAVLASLGVVAALSHLIHSTEATNSVVLLIGMAVGVDYSLFYLKREREERRGSAPEQALARAAATSGRAVLVSGTTVLIAMAGLLMTGSKLFSSFGVGATVVVLVTMVGSLTVLPALLGKLGDRVDRGVVAVAAASLLRLARPFGRRPRLLVRLRNRRTLLARLKGGGGQSRVGRALLRPALRHPVISMLATTTALVVLATPLLGIHTRLMGFPDLPKQLKIAASYDAMQHEFPGAQAPAVVVVQAPDVDAPAVWRALARLRSRALASPQMGGPVTVEVNPRHDLASVAIPLAGNGADSRSFAALATLRDRLLPETVGRVPGVTVAVTGQTAGTQEFSSVTNGHWPIVFAFVLGLAFVLLLVTFRSLVVPLTAIALNLLSVGAAYGVLVWIFQDGHFEGLLDFHSAGAIVTWLPLFLFAVLFGLSMDYHVFMVSRIKELVDRGVRTEEAVERGIADTAGTVTAAAAVMVAVFAIFATLSTLEIKQMGVGLAVAVLIDATVIRAVLLPSTMKLLGRWNWYLPRWLQWLPSVRAERHVGPAIPETA